MIPSVELTYFIEVAQTLNLSRAAERLNISQPSLSAAVKRLELAVGTTLLIRQKRGVTLTQAGKQLLTHFKGLIQYWDDIKLSALSTANEIYGSVVLGCHPSIGLYYLPEVLSKLLLQYSRLDIQFVHDISRKITEQVIQLSIDIGLVVNPIKHPDLIIHPLKNEEVSLWRSSKMNANHDLISGSAVILCDTALTKTHWLLKRISKKSLRYGRILSSPNLDLVAQLTAHGAGIGILPKFMAMSQTPKLIQLPHAPVYPEEICVIYRHENRNMKALQVIKDALKKYFN